MGILECKPIKITVNGVVRRIRPVVRNLCHGRQEITLGKATYLKGGLIIGEGDTGKSTYAQMLFDAVKHQGARAPMLIRLRSGFQPSSIPDIPSGEIQTIILDGLDEYQKSPRDISDFVDDLNPDRYRVWVTSRPGNAASIVAGSNMLETVYRLSPLTDEDLVKIADSVDLDGKSFLSFVRNTHFESFLHKPGGAIILMQLYANDKLRNWSRVELMEAIMNDFAEATRDGYLDRGTNCRFSHSQIVEATGWMATCLELTGKGAIWTGAKTACPLSDIYFGDIPLHGYDPELFHTALCLRLFEPLTNERLRLSYSDMPPFLVGRWLANNVPKDEVGALIAPNQRFVTKSRAKMIAWAGCYSPDIAVPWLKVCPELLLACHDSVTQAGLRQTFDWLVESYHRVEDAFSPIEFAYGHGADLVGFDAFIEFLRSVVSDRKSSEVEIALAKELLLGANKHATGKSVKTTASLPQQVFDEPVLLTEREVAELLREKEPEELVAFRSVPEEPPDPELYWWEEEFINEVYPDLDPEDKPTDEEKDQLERDREFLRDEFRYEHVYDNDDDELSPIDPQTGVNLDNDEERLRMADDQADVDKVANEIDANGTIIGRIMEHQENRGLEYCALTAYFRKRFAGDQDENVFLLPKLFASALKHDASTYMPVLVKAACENLLYGLPFLAALERSSYGRLIIRSLHHLDASALVDFYRAVMGAGALMKGHFLDELCQRFESEPTPEVIDTLEKRCHPVVVNRDGDDVLELDDILAEGGTYVKFTKDLLRKMRKARQGTGGTAEITLRELEQLGSSSKNNAAATKETKRARKNVVRAKNGELTQEDVAKDFGVSRKTVNKWEKEQTEDGPNNKSNPYHYYRALRKRPDLRDAYEQLARMAKHYLRQKKDAEKKGERFRMTFVRFNEFMLNHNQKK